MPCRNCSPGRAFYRPLASSATVLYFYDGWQSVVETDSAGDVEKEYVYGEGIDEVLRATLPEPTGVDIDGDAITAESAVDLYYHHNSLGSVMAVTNASGVVVEGYTYSPYGVTLRGKGPA